MARLQVYKESVKLDYLTKTMNNRYFILDNTPEAGRLNTFICHVSQEKGVVHFINADIFPKTIKINVDKKIKTKCYIIKAFVKNAFDAVDEKTKEKHTSYEIDKNSIEALPIKASKSKHKVFLYIKEQPFKVDTFRFAEQIVGLLRKTISRYVDSEIDISDCLKEITKEEYDRYQNELIEQKRIELAKHYNRILDKRLAENGLVFSKLKTKTKYYSRDEKLFFIQKRDAYDFRRYEKAFLDFDSFYKACNDDISDADLYDYDFNGINGNKYDFKNAIINSTARISLGLYTQKIINELKHDNYVKLVFMPSISENLVPDRMKYDITETYPIYEKDDNVFLYISDLHINHKLLKKKIDFVDDSKIDNYFTKIVLSLEKTIPLSHSRCKIIFIVGDVSFNYEMFRRFFRIYSKHISKKTFFILGNHELWDNGLCRKYSTFTDIVNEFRAFLNSINITLLENELYVPNTYLRSDEIKNIYSYDEILNLDSTTISKIFDINSYVVLGGMGFAGLSKSFNCLNGIYRLAPINREFEVEQSKHLSEIHKKLREFASNKKVIVVTHMPPDDWCDDILCPNWVYIYGHTHKNSYLESDGLTYYADNQIGYSNTSFGFKYFSTTSRYNIFNDYKDGIFEITREQYYYFYSGIGEHSSINRDFYKLFLLKNGSVMMFLLQKKENDPFFILNGGQIKKTNGESLEYFYSKMNNYAQSIKLFLNDYSNYQKKIVYEVKKIGGQGTVHGAIIDINFLSHIYVNPLDWTLTPYYARSMADKVVYKNILSLLKYTAPYLLNNYYKLLENKSASSNSLVIKDDAIDNKTTFVSDTSMYRVSRVIKGLQYTTEFNIIRLWNYSIADKPSKESGKELVSGLINHSGITDLNSIGDKKIK